MSALFVVPTIFKAIDKFSAPLKGMGDATENFANRAERNFRKVGAAAMSISKYSLIGGLAIATPLVLAAKSAIDFEDKMADVAKTTGLQGKQLEDYGGFILDLASTTRTSIDDILKIGEIGGQMGITGEALKGFTKSANEFNVALGKDFTGGTDEAIHAIAGLNVLFKETRGLKVDESITRVGSAINALSSKGVAVPEVTEFTKRIGALPDAIKPSLQDTAALGAVFNKTGLTAEIASRGFMDFMLTAAANLPAFASQMGISTKAAQDLLNTDPTAFAKKYAATFKGLKGTELAARLKKVKLGDAGTIKVIGTLASSTELLGKMQTIANDEFKKGTSLTDEYNIKNATAAANIQKFKNQIEVLSIKIGNELLPVLQKIIGKILPIGKSMIEWAKENRELTKTILKVVGGLGIFLLTLSAVSFIIGVGTKAIAAWGLVVKIATGVQWLWNAAMAANPIGLIIAAIIALIALTYIIIDNYYEWGAAMSWVLGPFALIINMVMSFKRNWDLIVKAFKEGGMIDGLLMIGATIVDALLMPLQQVLDVVHQLTGADWAKSASDGIYKLRQNMGVNVTDEGIEDPLLKKKEVNPVEERNGSLENAMTLVMQKISANLTVNVPNNNATVSSDNGAVKIRTSSTHGAGGSW